MSVAKNKEVAQDILSTATGLGWRVFVRGDVLTITKNIEKDSLESFTEADGEYYSILGLLPQTSAGSTWGTDGGSVGGMTAMKHGVMTMHKSGGNKNILRHLSRLQ